MTGSTPSRIKPRKPSHIGAQGVKMIPDFGVNVRGTRAGTAIGFPAEGVQKTPSIETSEMPTIGGVE